MNVLAGHIAAVETEGKLSLIRVDLGGTYFSVILIDTPQTAPYLSEGQPVNVIFKETEVVLGVGEELAISLQNRLRGKVKRVEQGELLSRVTVETALGDVVSVITSRAVAQLGLAAGVVALALIKTNEVMLAPRRKPEGPS